MAQVIPAILALASTGVAVYSAHEQASAATKAADFTAKVAENNARAASEQAGFEADRIRERARRLASRQQTDLLKSGVPLQGSALDVIADSAVQSELDALSAIYTGRISAGSEQSRAQLARLEGRNARRAGYLRAGESLLSGGAQTFSYAQDIKFGGAKKTGSASG